MQPAMQERIEDSAILGSMAPSVITPQVSLDPLDLIEAQQRDIRHRNWGQPVGRLAKILLGDGAIPSYAPDNPFIRSRDNKQPRRPELDWHTIGPMVARSKDSMGYLIVGRTVHPPPLSDPAWVRPPIYGKPGTGNPRIPGAKRDGLLLKYRKINGNNIPILEEAPKVEQRLCHVAHIGPDARWVKKDGKWVPNCDWYAEGRNGEKWMAFYPVSQIILSLFEGGGYGVINCTHDYSGNSVCFLYDRDREQGHLIFTSDRCTESFTK